MTPRQTQLLKKTQIKADNAKHRGPMSKANRKHQDLVRTKLGLNDTSRQLDW